MGACADVFCLRQFHFFVETNLSSPVKRMLAEQLVYSPLSNAGYLYLAKGSEWSLDEWAKVYMRDWSFWPLASYVGYRFVPVHSRYLYISFATLAWNSWRSMLVK